MFLYTALREVVLWLSHLHQLQVGSQSGTVGIVMKRHHQLPWFEAMVQLTYEESYA